MKTIRIISILILALFSQQITAQQPSINWDKWNFLIGEWVGEGNGQPGQGSGSFTFKTDLDGKILVRKSHTDFPATADRPAAVHNDLMCIYLDYTGSAAKAIYFDNEGHVIHYGINYSEKSIVFTSDIIPNTARFRLSYTLISSDTLNIKFEFASPQTPEDFKTYLEGKSMRKK